MKRLTKRVNGVVVYVGAHNDTDIGQIPCEVSAAGVREIMEQLAGYEDTELDPAMCANYKTFEDEAISKGVPFKRIVSLMEADRDGRLVVLGHPRRRVMWGDVEPDKLLCPECGNELDGLFPEQTNADLEMVNCPYCGEYLNWGGKRSR